jgi:outer membrane protein
MKSISLTLNIILILAVAGLYFLHFNEKKASTPTTPKTEAQVVSPKMDLKASSIVYVNSDSLMDNYDLVKEVKKELERERAAAEKQFAAEYRTLEAEYNDLKAKAATMTEEQGMAKQQELAMKEQKLTDYRDELNEKLTLNELKKTQKIQEEIEAYLKSNYSGTSYSYILGHTKGGGILYSKNALDITKEVLDGLNKTYQAQHKK